METPAIQDSTQKPSRPVLLRVLCILTFIGSGFGMILSVVGMFSSEWLLEQAEPLAPGILDYSKTVIVVLFLILAIIWALSLWGAILMFGLRKGGFVLYLIPNGLLLLLQIILTISSFDVFFLLYDLLCILFIVLYATQVRYMKE